MRSGERYLMELTSDGVTIEVDQVSKQFGTFVALDDVSIEVPGGSLTALLGPSGSGKSTLLRVIAGLEPPDSGSVWLAGADVTRTPPQARGVGFVFQHYAAFRHMTVWDNVAFGLQVRKRPNVEIRARVAELLHLVQLEGLAGRYPSQLSGGQRQRMALARALAVQPAVLLLDEPFGALDARVRKELRDWLRRLHDDVHVTTVLVTHDQEEAMEVADRVVVMDHGRVQQVGSPRELYEHPANAFVMSFVGPVNHLDGTFVRPHDVVIHPLWAARAPAGREAVVERLTHLGFEVRVELALTDGGTRLWSQITRADLERLGLEQHQRVYVESLRSRTFAPDELVDALERALPVGTYG
jgi:sulfate transport system ATP-binding protein